MSVHPYGQIAFRYRAVDTQTGVTRATTQRLSEVLGVDETQVIHLALQKLASTVLPRYAADDGALTDAQLANVKASAPKRTSGAVVSSLFDEG